MRFFSNLKNRVFQRRSISSLSFQTTNCRRAGWCAITWVLLVAFCMEGLFASKTFHRFCWFPKRFLANRAVRTGRGVATNVLKVVIEDSLVKGRNIMASLLAKFEEESKQEVLHKPDSSHRAITQDSTSLHLHHAGGVVKMNSNGCRDTTAVSSREPENSVEFYSFVVNTCFYVRTGDGSNRRQVRESRG